MSEDRPQDPNNPWATPAVPPGPPPPNAPLPYGQGAPPPYGQGAAPPPPPGYGQQPYGQQNPQNPQSAQVRSSATLWLILNIVSVLFCSNLPGIAGAIYAGLALGRVDADPADAQRKIRLSRIWFFAGLVLVLLGLVVAVIGLLVYGSNSSSGIMG